MAVNSRLTTGLHILIWKPECLINFKARHNEKKVLLTKSKWKENLPESAQEATVRNNKGSFKLKKMGGWLCNNCRAVSFNKENAYILFLAFMMKEVTQNLIKLKQVRQIMIGKITWQKRAQARSH